MCRLIYIVLISATLYAGMNGVQILKEVQDKYNSAIDLTANFEQVIYHTGMKRQNKSAGKIIFKKPNMMKWIQEKPDMSLYISNGKKMWLYLPDEKQVYINENMKEVIDKVGLLFLSGDKNLFEKFKIYMLEKNEAKKVRKKNINLPASSEVTTFEFIPKKQEGFLRAVFRVDVKSKLITKVTVYDLAKNKTVVALNSVKFNVGAKNSFFDFVPPKEAEIYSTDNYK